MMKKTMTTMTDGRFSYIDAYLSCIFQNLTVASHSVLFK